MDENNKLLVAFMCLEGCKRKLLYYSTHQYNSLPNIFVKLAKHLCTFHTLSHWPEVEKMSWKIQKEKWTQSCYKSKGKSSICCMNSKFRLVQCELWHFVFTCLKFLEASPVSGTLTKILFFSSSSLLTTCWVSPLSSVLSLLTSVVE